MTKADESDSPTPARRVTTADVARLSGVSRATVSYVLNRVSDQTISDATRRRVLAAAAELGHVPNAAARALRSGKSNLVLVLVPGFAMGTLFDKAIAALNDALAPRGIAVIVHHHDEKLRSIYDLWQLVAPTLIVTMGGIDPDDLRSVDESGIPWVDTGNILSMQRIGEEQAEYLAERGHRRLAFARPTDDTLRFFADRRLEGVRDYCRSHGLPEPIVVDVDAADPQSAREALAECLERTEPITAICCHNDEVAISLMMTRRSEHIGEDRELAIIGVDDIPVARLGLTTIAIDIDALSQTIVESVLQRLDGEPVTVPERDYIHVIARESA